MNTLPRRLKLAIFTALVVFAWKNPARAAAPDNFFFFGTNVSVSGDYRIALGTVHGDLGMACNQNQNQSIGVKSVRLLVGEVYYLTRTFTPTNGGSCAKYSEEVFWKTNCYDWEWSVTTLDDNVKQYRIKLLQSARIVFSTNCGQPCLQPDSNSTVTATMEGSFSSPITNWSFSSDSLGCQIVTNGISANATRITAGVTPGVVTVRASDSAGCIFERDLELCMPGSTGCNGQCTTFGQMSGGNLGQVSVNIGANGQPMATVWLGPNLSGSVPMGGAFSIFNGPGWGNYSANKFAFNYPSPYSQVNSNGNNLTQIKVPSGLGVVTNSSTNGYTINLYGNSNIIGQVNGVYLVTNSPFASVVVTNMSGGTASNQVDIIEHNNGNVQTTTIIFTNNGAILITGGGSQVTTVTTTSANNVQTITRNVSGDGSVVSQVVNRYETFAWGRAHIEQIMGSGGSGLTNTMIYNTNSTLRQVNRSDGSWEIYVYDQNDRVIQTFSSFLNQGPTTNSALCRLREHNYTSAAVSGANDDGTLAPYNQRSTIESLLGVPISHHYSIFTNGFRRNITCHTLNTNWSDGNNIVTTTYTHTNGVYFGRPFKIEHSNGRMDLFNYSSDVASSLLDEQRFFTTRQSGYFWTETEFIYGASNHTVTTGSGRLLAGTNWSIWYGGSFSFYPVMTGWQVYSDFDEEGRARRVDYSDGTFDYSGFNCCNQTLHTNREGTVFLYGYDALERWITTTSSGVTTSNVFDAFGRVLAVVRHGSDGTVITNRSQTYDSAGRMVASRDGLGNTTTFTNFFDAQGYRIEVTVNPDGSRMTNTYYRDGSLCKAEGSAGFPRLYSYGIEDDGSGVLYPYTREQGGHTNELTKTYRDRAGRAKKTVFAASGTNPKIERTYHAGPGWNQGRLAKEVDADGVATLYDYAVDEAFGLYEVDTVAVDVNNSGAIDFSGTDRITETVRNEYENEPFPYGLVAKTTVSRWSTDGTGDSVDLQVIRTDPQRTFTWSESGGVEFLSATFATNGWRYATNTAPDGTVSLSTSKDGRLVRQERSHPQLGSLAVTTYGYDAHGRLAYVTNGANGTVTTSLYDKADRLVTNIVTAAGLAAQSMRYVYDSMGRVTQTILPDGAVTYSSYYQNGLLAGKSGGREYPVSYAYDYAGRLTNMTTWQNASGEQGAASTVWKYDGYRGFLTNKLHADGKGTSYTYTDGGKLKTRLWARGTNTTYAYNAAGELLSTTYSDANTPSVTNTYDRLGRVVKIMQGSNATLRAYNTPGQLLIESYAGGPLHGLAVSNYYDSLLRRTQVSVQQTNGTTLFTHAYAYDDASRLAAASDGTNSAGYTYLTNSALVGKVQFTNGGALRMTTSKTYDGLNRLTAIGSTNASGTVISAHAYAYNAANQRTQAAKDDATYWVYAYDSLGQVVSGKKYWSDGTPVAGQQFEYGFDDIGNRKFAASGGNEWGTALREERYTANALNQYTQRTVPASVDVLGAATNPATVTVNLQPTYRKGEYFRANVPVDNSSGPVWLGLTNVAAIPSGTNNLVRTNLGHLLVPKAAESFTYDLDGNLTSDSLWTNSWNAENRLVSLTNRLTVSTSAWKRVDCSYDAQGRRISKTVSNWLGNGWQLSYSHRFVYDGWNLLAILDGPTSVMQSFLWGLDLSGSMQGAGGVGGLLALNAGTNQSHFVAFDGNGNVAGLTSATNGAVTARYEYSPFGVLLIADGPMARANAVRFSTKLHDEETDTLYYGYRDYLPYIGRWSSIDPSGPIGGLNLFSILRNCPIIKFDYLGLFTINNHIAITESAFNQTISSLSPTPVIACRVSMLSSIRTGNVSQDLMHLSEQERHYNRDVNFAETDTDKQQADTAYESQLSLEASDFATFINTHLTQRPTTDECDAQLFGIGRMLHSFQDFYAHAIRRDGRGGRENSSFLGWTAWSVGITGTPESRGNFWPSSYSFGMGGEHPALEEPVVSPPELTARYNAAVSYSQAQLDVLLPTWWSVCRCRCPGN